MEKVPYVAGSKSVEGLLRDQQQPGLGSKGNGKPVQVSQDGSHVTRLLRAGEQSGCCILDQLQAVERRLVKTSVERAAVVNPGGDKCMNSHLQLLVGNNRAQLGDVPQVKKAIDTKSLNVLIKMHRLVVLAACLWSKGKNLTMYYSFHAVTALGSLQAHLLHKVPLVAGLFCCVDGKGFLISLSSQRAQGKWLL